MKTLRPDVGPSGEHPEQAKRIINNARFTKELLNNGFKSKIYRFSSTILIFVNEGGVAVWPDGFDDAEVLRLITQ